MKLRYKIVNALLLVVVLGLSALGVVLSHNAECGPAPQYEATATTMKAVVYRCYGSAEVLQIEDVPVPVPAAGEVLVKVAAASVNPLDWHYMRGSPYIMRLQAGLGAPADHSMGVDFSGTVEAIGEGVTRFRPGDQVFGGRSGAFAEYVVVRQDGAIASKPSNMSFEQAAAVPVAGVTALQALRDQAGIDAGDRVLINGASGGVGTFAVQIAKALGAEVSGVCSTRNVAMVRSIGADEVFDYTKEDYTESDRQFDIIVDNVGNHSLSKNRKVLVDKGNMVIVGAQKGDWFGPFAGPLWALIVSPFIDEDISMFISEFRQEDLEYLGELMESGKLTPVLDERQFGLYDIPDAVRYSEEGHARGKIVVNIQ